MKEESNQYKWFIIRNIIIMLLSLIFVMFINDNVYFWVIIICNCILGGKTFEWYCQYYFAKTQENSKKKLL